MEQIFTDIRQILENAKPVFITEENKLFIEQQCQLFATRTAGMAGKDFIFFYNMDKLGQNKIELEKIHESGRKYGNSFFKMPKWFRFRVPNIVSVFLTNENLKSELIEWSMKPTRTIVGGEFHSIYFIHIPSKSFYGQGSNRTNVDAPFIKSIEFKKIDPQNRAYYTISMIMAGLFGK